MKNATGWDTHSAVSTRFNLTVGVASGRRTPKHRHGSDVRLRQSLT
jgi:hypothetical protein